MCGNTLFTPNPNNVLCNVYGSRLKFSTNCLAPFFVFEKKKITICMENLEDHKINCFFLHTALLVQNAMHSEPEDVTGSFHITGKSLEAE